MVKIKDTDKGYRKMLKLLTSGKKPVVQVGIFGEKGAETHKDSDGLTVLEVGAFHEFGLGNNPERSFIRGWVDENESKVVEFLGKEVERATKNGAEDFDQGLERLGLFCQSGIQARMSQGIPPPLKKATVDRKGSTVPLIDTGQLRASITYKVHPDGVKE